MAGLLNVPLFADETLLSYLSRLARANGANKASKFCRDMGIPFNDIRNGDAEAISKLAERINADPHLLIQRSVHFSAEYTVTMSGEKFSHPQIAKNVFRFCPLCFQTDDASSDRMPDTRRYQRAEWLVRAFRCCPDHGCELIETSAHESGTDLNRSFDGIYLHQGASDLVTRQQTPSITEHFIRHRLRGIRNHGELLDQSTMATALSFGMALGIAVTFGKDQLVPELDSVQKADGVRVGLTILKQGERAFMEAIDSIAAQPSKSSNRGFQIFGRFARVLHNTRTFDDYDRFRSLAIKRAGEITPLSSRWREKTSLLSVGGIARQTGLSRDLVQSRLINQGYALETLKLGVNPNAIALFVDPSQRLVNTRQSSQLLRIDAELLEGLEKAGLVRRANRKSVESETEERSVKKIGRPSESQGGRFVEDELIRLRDDLLRKCQLTHSPSMLTLRKYSRVSGEKLASLFRSILDGRIPAALFGEAPDLIDRIFVETVRQHGSEYLTATEAVSELDIRSGTLTMLLKHNLIRSVTTQTKAQRFATKLITRDDAAQFTARYVTIGQLQKISGLDRNTIRRRMTKRGIAPAFPPADVLSCFIDRSNVDRILADD